MFTALSLHALYYLMCHWVVSFKAATQFAPASIQGVGVGCQVLVVPPANRGKSAMVVMKKSITGEERGGSSDRGGEGGYRL